MELDLLKNEFCVIFIKRTCWISPSPFQSLSPLYNSVQVSKQHFCLVTIEIKSISFYLSSHRKPKSH